MQAEQQSERERFEAWCKQDNPRYEPTDDSPLNRRDWKVWQARDALSHPSTPQGWKQIGWTCGDGDCGRIHEAPGADGSYAVPVYVQAPPEQGSKG